MGNETKTEIGWALVELMGHQRIVGNVSESVVAGGAFLRVDVPESDGQPAFTRMYGSQAIYCISPVAEDVARELIKRCRPEPVSRWEVPQLVERVEADPDLDSSCGD